MLEALDDPVLKAHYQAIYGTLSAHELLDAHPGLAAQISPEFFAFCDRVLQGRSAALAGSRPSRERPSQ